MQILSYTQDMDTYPQSLAIVVTTTYDEIGLQECRCVYHIYKSQAHFDRVPKTGLLWNGEFQAPYMATQEMIDELMLTNILGAIEA